MNKKYLKLATSLISPLLAGFIGSYFTTPSIESWYVFLQKPSFAPPNWIFAPVWTALYILMGISLYLIWKKGNSKLVLLFFVHLALNSLWSIIFFGFKNPLLAFGEIVVLWFFVLFLNLRFYKINRTAGLLLIPYLLWTSFAAYLNFSIWRLNA